MSVCVEQSNLNNNQYSGSFPSPDNEILNPSSPETYGLSTKVIKTLSTWRNRSRQRNSLATLDERLLADIGYTPAQARVEFNKPFWK